MNKLPYKVMAFSSFITIMTANVVAPLPTFANEQVQSNIKQDALVPIEMKSTVKASNSAARLMNEYTLKILKQADIDFKNVKLPGNEHLETQIWSDQQVARQNARYWNYKIKPNIIKTNQNIIHYNKSFQELYHTLVDAAENQNKTVLQNGIEKLSMSIMSNKKEVDQLIQELTAYREQLGSDTRNIKKSQNTLDAILKADGTFFSEKRVQLQKISDEIKNDENKIHELSTTNLINWYGTTSVRPEAGWKIHEARENISKMTLLRNSLEAVISEAESTISTMTVISGQLKEMTNVIDDVIDAFITASNQWGYMQSKYASLLDNISLIDDQGFAFIKEDLRTTKDSWEDLKEYAEHLYKDVKILEEEAINVETESNIKKGFQNKGGKWYYFGQKNDGTGLAEGEMAKWTKIINGKSHYFSGDGSAWSANSWLKDYNQEGQPNTWYILDKGEMAYGWKQIDKKWYYFDPNNGCKVATGFQSIDGKKYYLKAKDDGLSHLDVGQMATDWFKIGEEWYRTNEDGALNVGTLYWESDKYFFDKTTGKSLFSIRKSGNEYYGYGPGGSEATRIDGLQEFDGKTYYFENGKMVTGWRTWDNCYFSYFDSQGEMVVGSREIDGQWYNFDSQGETLEYGR